MRAPFQRNIGPVDQWLRLSAGFVLLVLTGLGLIGAWGFIGVLPMVTAMFGHCPLYRAFGIHTGRRRGGRH